MSQENIRVVQGLYAAFHKRDREGILGLVSPQMVVIQSPELPWGGHYDGIEGLQAFFGKLMAYLNNEALPIEHYLDAGDHVVAIGRTQGTVKATGKRFDVPLAHVWQVKDGKALRFTPFIDHPTMFAALGL